MAKEIHVSLNIEDILALAENAHVPECREGLDRPLSEIDYDEYKQTVEHTLLAINRILNEKNKNCSQDIDVQKLTKDNKLLIVHLLILCGEYATKDYWTSECSVKIMTEVKENILICLSISTIEELFRDNITVFKSSLMLLRPKLLSNTWKCNPAAVSSYCWLLAQVKYPFLNDYLNDVLPTALILTDDFEVPNKVKGLNCLNHIIDNVAKADLEMFGQNEVILDELRTLLSNHELDFLEPLLVCIVTLLRKMNPMTPFSDLERNKFDDVFDIILFNVEMEGKKSNKILFLRHLPNLIAAFRLRTVRHLRKLLSLIGSELEIEGDIHFIRILLDVFDITIKFCWPRCNYYKCQPVVLSLLKVLHNHSMCTDKNVNYNNDDFILRVKSSLLLLKQLFTVQMEQLAEDIINSEKMENKFKMVTEFIFN